MRASGAWTPRRSGRSSTGSTSSASRATRWSSSPPTTARRAVSEYRAPRAYGSLRRGGLSYIGDGPEERLFDLLRDPGERQNVLATRPAEAAAMRATLEGWRRNCRALALLLGPRGGTIAPSDHTARRLGSLG